LRFATTLTPKASVEDSEEAEEERDSSRYFSGFHLCTEPA